MVYYKKYSTQNMVYIAISIGCAVFFLNQLWDFVHDDAYIVLAYSRNLVEGNGLVWVHGQRVEGCTQFLWIALCAAVKWLIAAVGGLNIDLIFLSKLLGTFFTFSTLLLLFLTSDKKRIPLGGLLLATNCCFTLWAAGGLETVMCGFFIFLGCTLYLREKKNSFLFFINGIIFCLVAMTRLEGLLFFGMTFLFILFRGSLPFKRRLNNTGFFVLGFLIIFLPYFIWRFAYFGDVLPCVVYAKGGTNIFKMLFGVRYVLHFLATFGFPLVLILFVKNFRNFIAKHIYLILLLSAYSFYVFIIGGDHMQGYRFFVPILPIFYLFVQECFYAFRFKGAPAPTTAVAILLVAANFYFSFSMIPRGPEATIAVVKPHFQYRICQTEPDTAAYYGKYVGLYIKDHWPKDSVVALNAAGAGPYYSRMNCIDMLGLNNYAIAKRKIDLDASFLLKDPANIFKLFYPEGRAELSQQIKQRYSVWQLLPGHGKGDGKYVLSQKPDYIILGGAEGSAEPWFLGDKEIFESPDFKNNYELKIERIQINDDFYKSYKQSKTGILEFKYYMRKQH